MVEGARLSGLQGDLRFPFRYAIYNTLPSLVGGTLRASEVAATMTGEPPVLQSCPRAVARAYNLRALRTALAGCTALSIVLQVTIAGGRATEAYQQAVAEGREVPDLFAGPVRGQLDSDIPLGVLRLCGPQGLEPALLAARHQPDQGLKTAFLPVVVAGVDSNSGMSWLPEGALAAIASYSSNPAYFRVDSRRLFSAEAWRPVTRRLKECADSCNQFVLLEADTLSSETPQALLMEAARAPTDTMVSAGEHGSTRGRGRGHLTVDQASWALAMLHGALQDKEEHDGGGGLSIPSVILAGSRRSRGEEESTVEIDARAALLLSVLTWVQQCEEFVAAERDGYAIGGAELGGVEDVTDEGTAWRGATVVSAASNVSTTSTVVVEDSAPSNVSTGSRTDHTASESTESGSHTVTPILRVLETMGRGVRHTVSATRHFPSTITRPFGMLSSWFSRLGGASGRSTGKGKVLLYDTDSEEYFFWVTAQMRRQGWTVMRVDERPDRDQYSAKTSSPGGVRGDSAADPDALSAPVLVHHCTDEKTLSVAARHLARIEGPPVCAVVHQWECGAQARQLLSRLHRKTAGLGVNRGESVEVICTAEIGEGLLELVRRKLRSGARAGEVQELLDDLFGRFYTERR